MDVFFSIWEGYFRIEGLVQGVSFRRYTQKQALKLGLRGYCMNTNDKAVEGVLQGPLERYLLMKEWLTYTGSPNSRIDKAHFYNEDIIFNYSQPNFTIKYNDGDNMIV